MNHGTVHVYNYIRSVIFISVSFDVWMLNGEDVCKRESAVICYLFLRYFIAFFPLMPLLIFFRSRENILNVLALHHNLSVYGQLDHYHA